MQAWQEHGFAFEWAKEAGLDVRGLRFARDVRRQLDGITGPNGSHLLGMFTTSPTPTINPPPPPNPHHHPPPTTTTPATRPPALSMDMGPAYGLLLHCNQDFASTMLRLMQQTIWG